MSITLNHTDGCVNFRDIGEFVNLITNKPFFIEGKIFRGGSIDYIQGHEDIANVKSIINLRNGPDSKIIDADYYHFPMSNKIEKYDTSQKEVKTWLNQIFRTFEDPNLKFPVLIHCLSGKDRTGIVVAALLLILGINEKTIIEEYLLSDGEVHKELINLTLNGLRDTDKYFDRINLIKVKENLTRNIITSTNF